MSNQKHEHHIIPLSTYFKVFGALMVLTALTVITAQVDLGGWANIVLAMFIATIKASLVLMFFMHLYYDNKTNLIFFLGSVLFLIIFITFTLIDVDYRDKIYKEGAMSPQDDKSYKEYITKQPSPSSDH